jgi:AcrR family transcriptional regulator
LNRVEAAFAERAVRREGGVERPLGPKATRTREAILVAAGEAFARGGYQRTTVADVAGAAGLSLGTVYQYFRDRTDLVAALVQRNVMASLAGPRTPWQVGEGEAGLRPMLEAFVTSYARTASLASLWEEVTFVDDSLADLRRSLTHVFEGSITTELRRAARSGLIDPALATEAVARALAAMVDRWCYLTYVFDPPPGPPADPGEAAALLARLWAGALGLTGQPTYR